MGQVGVSPAYAGVEAWTDLERFIPRAEWPAEIDVGQRGPRWRHPDPAVVQAIDAYRQELAVLIAEAEDDD